MLTQQVTQHYTLPGQAMPPPTPPDATLAVQLRLDSQRALSRHHRANITTETRRGLPPKQCSSDMIWPDWLAK